MSSGGGRKYGVQVGNETYSLILTPEDWEKRRQDRENAKKLSLANNRRRKALDDRKRVAEARENRKRELELLKRRQRQIEATERYQRFRTGAKDKRNPTTENFDNSPNLDEVLQKLRGGYGDGVTTVPSSTATNTTATEKSYFIAEQNSSSSTSDQEGQSRIMERAPWTNMKEYAEDLKRQILSVHHADNEQTSGYRKQGIQDENLPDDNDGQDSLHGSSISASSQPSSTSLTVTKKEAELNKTVVQPFSETNYNTTKHTNSDAQEHTMWKENSTSNNYNYQTNGQTPEKSSPLQQYQDALNQQLSSTAIIRGSEAGVLCKRDSQTGRITYYVKAYRPSSASLSHKTTFQNTFNHSTNVSMPVRPSSSYDIPRKPAQNDYNVTPKPRLRNNDTWVSSNPTVTATPQVQITEAPKNASSPSQQKQPESVVNGTSSYFSPYSSIKVSSYRVSSAPIGSTTATPVSPFFNQTSKQNSTLISSMAPQTNGDSSLMHPSGGTQILTRPSSTTVTFSDASEAIPNNGISFISETATEKSEDKGSDKRELKGILRRHSKYDTYPGTKYGLSHPSYQSAGIARQKWLYGITTGDTNKKEPRVRSAESKSVRWHQVQYNDGTSSALDGNDGKPVVPTPQVAPPPKSQPTPKSPRAKAPKKPATARPKTSPSRGMRGGKVRSAGRRLRPAKEPQINLVPHPPPQKQSPKLSMSTVVNYSIDPSENVVPLKEYKATSAKQRSSNTNKRMSPITHNKIVVHRKGKADNHNGNGEAVTMSTLKSRGNDSRTVGGNDESVLVNHGNQVTIKVSSSKPIISVPPSTKKVSAETGRIPLNGTPTDQEIEMLWDKVRAYLAWNRNRGNNQVIKKMRGSPERKIAWSTQNESSTKQISANIISIDGGIFSKQTTPEETNFQNGYKTQQLPVHYERFGIGKSRKLGYSPSVTSQEYGYHANHGPQLREKVRGTIPVTKHSHPSSAPVRRTTQLTDSIKTFRLVEALIEQNVPEEQILNALNSLQSATREI